MYPIVIFWNLMLVASVAGIMKVHRSSRAVYLVPILVFVGVYMVAFGITVANIGTVIRYRDTIMPIVAMLASGAIANPKTSGEDYVLKK
jgi:ABC-type polysaccharide/polyol phosphate export permease